MAPSDLSIELREAAPGPLGVLSRLLGAVLSAASVVSGAIGSESFSDLVPQRRLVIADRGSGRVLLQFDAPALGGRRLLHEVRRQAAVMPLDELLRRWGDEESRQRQYLRHSI